MSTYETAQAILALFGAALAVFGWLQVCEIKKLRRAEADRDRLVADAAGPPAK
jgi:hypothetical protein